MTTITSRRRRRSSSTRRSEVSHQSRRRSTLYCETPPPMPTLPPTLMQVDVPSTWTKPAPYCAHEIWFSWCRRHALLRCHWLLRRRSEGLQRDDSDQQSNNDNSHGLPSPLVCGRKLIGTNAAVRCFHGMGPREEDNSVFLLSAVALVCGMIAFVPWLLEPTPAVAKQKRPACRL